MPIIAALVMAAWIPIVIGIFALVDARKAVLISCLIAWMFLPSVSYEFQGLPDVSKVTTTNVAITLGVFLFDTKRFFSFRPHWLDVPMIVFCGSQFVTSVVNNLGAYDGASMVFKQVVMFGLPYFVGRLYFCDVDGLKALAIAIFIGGLVYVPFCVYEMRFSPQLHRMLYGKQQHSFAQTVRSGGYRPMVFMQGGLMVAMWMSAATLMGCWLWACGTIKRIWNVPVGVLVVVQLITTLMCRSFGAVVLLGVGTGALFLVKWRQGKWVIALLILVAPTYLALRLVADWQVSGVVEMVEKYIGAERAQSLKFRIDSEHILIVQAMERPILGRGAWAEQELR